MKHGLILLVNADMLLLRRIERRLTEEGYLVAALSSFQQARDLLSSITPDLLVADSRLDAYNGMLLAIRARLNRPTLPVIITHSQDDPVLADEARRQKVMFVVNPLTNPEFLRGVKSVLDEPG